MSVGYKNSAASSRLDVVLNMLTDTLGKSQPSPTASTKLHSSLSLPKRHGTVRVRTENLDHSGDDLIDAANISDGPDSRCNLMKVSNA